MNIRKVIIGSTGVVIFIGVIALSGLLSGGDEEVAEEKTAVATVVRTKKVSTGEVTANVEITGRIIPADNVELYAEVSGVSSYGPRPFKAGIDFKKGETLIRIDSRELASTLASSKSQFMSTLAQVLPDLKLDFNEVYPEWKEYLLNLDVNKPTPALPDVNNEQLKLFLTGRNIYSSYYTIKQSETRLSKYVIRAPFNGSLTESAINQGALVRNGQKLGEFMKSGAFELEGSVLFDELKYLKIGMEIVFQNVNGSNQFTGKLIRINEKVDANSQLVKVYFKLSSPEIKSGLFLEGAIPANTYNGAVELPIQALVEDQFVFTMDQGKAVKKQVSVVNQNANSFIATGLQDGTVVVIDKKNSAFEGSSIIAM